VLILGRLLMRLELICSLLWSRLDFKIGGEGAITVIDVLMNIYWVGI